MRKRRGQELAMVFQDPLSSLNPVVRIGVQITEVLERHRKLRGEAARKEAAHLLDRVGIPDPTRRLEEYPTSCPAACASGSSSRSPWPARRGS
ncbi:hypothetical protein GCM10029992_19380 [Glycomyces albus]